MKVIYDVFTDIIKRANDFMDKPPKEQFGVLIKLLALELIILLTFSYILYMSLAPVPELITTHDVQIGKITRVDNVLGDVCTLEIDPPMVQHVEGHTYTGKRFTTPMPITDVCANATVGKCLWGNKYPVRLYVTDCQILELDLNIPTLNVLAPASNKTVFTP